MSFLLGTTLLAVVTAVACALPGVFVVLRRNSMLVDAIAHAVLPGIVLGYFFTHDLKSPFLILGAAAAGMLVVLGSEALSRLGLVTGDAPQGLIFPALFSVGVIAVSMRLANVHLDVDAVLVGDLNLASFEQLTVGGVTIGPRYLFVMLGVLAANAVFIGVFYRHLAVTTLDADFARSMGLRVTTLNTAFMFGVSLTVTAAFNAAGAVLVLALVIAPATTAYLLTTRLATMLWLTVTIAVVGALGGFWLAYVTDVATSAGMAVTYGALFAVAFVGVRVREKLALQSVGSDTQIASVADSPNAT